MTSEPEGLVRNTSMAINYPTSVTKKVAEQFKMVNSMVVNLLVNFFSCRMVMVGYSNQLVDRNYRKLVK